MSSCCAGFEHLLDLIYFSCNRQFAIRPLLQHLKTSKVKEDLVLRNVTDSRFLQHEQRHHIYVDIFTFKECCSQLFPFSKKKKNGELGIPSLKTMIPELTLKTHILQSSDYSLLRMLRDILDEYVHLKIKYLSLFYTTGTVSNFAFSRF